jgi:hypothetical protein
MPTQPCDFKPLRGWQQGTAPRRLPPVDYVPIVDPLTYQLVGIVSASDVNQTPLAHAAESTPRLPNSLN